MRHRELLGELARLAYETIKELMLEAAGDDKARPGIVAVPQTFGSLIHRHILTCMLLPLVGFGISKVNGCRSPTSIPSLPRSCSLTKYCTC